MIPVEWGLPLFIFLLLFDLLLAATRVSLLNARPLRLLSLRDEKKAVEEKTIALIENPRLRPTLRFSQTLTRILLAAIPMYWAWQAWAESRSVALILLGIALLLALLLMSIEFTIEGGVLQDPEHWSVRFSGFAQGLVFVMTPLIYLPVLLLNSKWPAPLAAKMTEDELKNWVETDQSEGGLELEERQMIYSIFQFGDTLAREIMVPRTDVLTLDVRTTMKQAVDAFVQSGHSRVPVFENEIDNVIGLLYAKDLLLSMQSGAKESLRDLLRPTYFVPDSKKADALLTEMQAGRIHLAVVVDEYGGMAGIVTLEDIIEEIIGEIQDEYDASEELPMQQVGEGEYLFRGRIDLDDFNEVMGSHIPKIESDTLGGYLYDQLGRIPHSGESLETSGLLLTIEQVTGRRIRRVRARRIPPAGDKPHDKNLD